MLMSGRLIARGAAGDAHLYRRPQMSRTVDKSVKIGLETSFNKLNRL